MLRFLLQYIAQLLAIPPHVWKKIGFNVPWQWVDRPLSVFCVYVMENVCYYQLLRRDVSMSHSVVVWSSQHSYVDVLFAVADDAEILS